MSGLPRGVYMTENLHLLVVDDDADMRMMLSDALSASGYQAHVAANGTQMWAALERFEMALVILDLKLEREDGLTLARALRDKSDLPILMLTGQGNETDRILSLELAADDFLMKPFNIRELVARVHALLRRSQRLSAGAAVAPQAEHHERYAFGQWILDLTARELTDIAGQRLDLTYAEFNLLEAFVRSPSRVWTRDQLLAHSRGLDVNVYDRTIDVLILRLRRKIEPNPRQPQYIRTERGVGYIFAQTVRHLE